MASAKFRSTTLHKFLNQRYLVVLIGLVLLFTLLVLFIRHGAMDDTTDYYMHYEANVLSEYYQVTDQIIEFDEGVKEYYWGLGQLPQKYQMLLEMKKEQQLILNETQAFELADKFVYILPYFNEQKSAVFFVIHLFDLHNEAVFYQAWQNSFISGILLLLVLTVYFSLRTNRKITYQMLAFHQWVTAVANLKLADIEKERIPDTLTFDELTSSAQSLQMSLLAQYQLQRQQQCLIDREKHFLSSLSHELRTPISIMSAGLTLLAKSEAITAKDQKKLDKLRKANQRMKQLTHVLLMLWRTDQATNQETPQPKFENKVFLLDDLVERLIDSCHEQFKRQNIHFTVEKKDSVRLFAPYELIEIMLHNLLRNACQYTANNLVTIELNETSLMVENNLVGIVTGDISANEKFRNELTSSAEKKAAVSSSANYGYGVGLFLVEKIAQQIGCQIQIDVNEQRFRVEVFFNTLYDDTFK